MQFFNFTRGANYGLSPFLMPPDQLTGLNGAVINEKLGALTKDTGYSRVGAQIQDNKNITGLFDFHQSPTVQRTFATVNDSTDDDLQLFAKTPAGAWTEIGAAETAWL